MLRSIRIASAVAAACAVAISCSATAIAAAPPRGTLTGTEYRQLSQELVALKRFLHGRTVNWNRGFAACNRAGRSTALLRSQRAGCAAGIGFLESLLNFYADAQRCAALATSTTTSTTTTPTTTAPTGTTTTATTTTATTPTPTTTTPSFNGTELKVIACLQPEYQLISRTTRNIYRADSALRRQVLRRGFVGRCLLTLAETPSELRLERRFALTSRRLSADIALLSKVADGQAPPSAVNATAIEHDAAQFGQTGRVLLRQRRPQKLAVCPHR